MKCTYCETTSKHAAAVFCDFCNAPLDTERPSQKSLLTIDHAESCFQELQKYHTYDLLVLLSQVRSERSSSYDTMITLKRLLTKTSGSQESLEANGTVKYTEDEYRRYTARMKVLEGILIDRMGYKPKRVDSKLLASLQQKIQANK